ncbi:MAG TPA: universal stress protein [Spirochaetia bacterium]|nr:universal stress protein [Spirochaetia bacterium]
MRINALLYSDGSERSLSAAIYAAALMKGNPHVNLTIISLSQPVKGSAAAVWDEAWSVAGAVDGVSRQILRETKKVFDDREIKVKSVVVDGGDGVPERIVEYAQEGNFNLIIMGTKGPSDLKGLVLGSVAHRVVNLSDRPVLLVKKLPPEILATLGEG